MSAIESADKRYRYQLERRWSLIDPGNLLLVMLNPSQAGAIDNDATIRKGIGFGERLGAGRLIVVNMYPYRATAQPVLYQAIRDGVPMFETLNEDYILEVLEKYDGQRIGRPKQARVVVAWGNLRKEALPARDATLRILQRGTRCDPAWQIQCWGLTRSGHPRHPLRLGYATPLRPYAAAMERYEAA